MSPAANQPISPGRVVLSLVVLLGVWLAFQFYPRRQPAPSLPLVMAESKLRAVGLPDNVDWEGLPEFFALVADQAEWKEGRTRFAYWHPVMKTYSYYLEATREGAGFRFKEIPEPREPDHGWDKEMAEGSQIRFYVAVPATLPLEKSPEIISQPDVRAMQFEINRDKTPPSIPPMERPVIPPSPPTIP